MSKYNARRVSLDGYTFDSQAEARRYQELILLQRTGAISDLHIHPTLELVPTYRYQGEVVRGMKYEADFSYCMYLDGEYRQVYEDVKGMRTAVYLLKRKLLLWRYPDIWFREVEA